MLTGAGIGAGVNLLRGKDPLQGAVLGGAGGAMAGGAFGGAGAGSTAGKVFSQGPAHLGNVATSQAFTPGILTQGANTAGGGLLSGFGDKLSNLATTINDTTGMENKDWTMLGLSNIDKLTPEQQQQIQHANLPQLAGNPTAIKGQVNTVGPIDQQIAKGGTQTFGLGPQEEIEQRSMYQNPAWGRRIGG